MGSDTDSSPKPDLAAALHRLRSTLARLKAELELGEVDGTMPPVGRLLQDLDEAFASLAAAEDANHSPARVLVVDDDARLAQITALGLRRLGYAAGSSTTVRALQAGEVLIFDLSLLAGLDISAVAALRSARPIVVTGATDAASRALASSINASDYIVKPIVLEELSAAISRRSAEAPG